MRIERRGFERIGPQGWNGTGVALGSQRPTPERVTEARVRLLDMLADVPAIVLGRRSDVLAWNRAGIELLILAGLILVMATAAYVWRRSTRPGDYFPLQEARRSPSPEPSPTPVGGS